DIASGRVLANRIRYRLGDALQRFIDDGKLVIGICNGFQVLVKMGLLPAMEGGFRQEVTLTHNDSARFEDRWVWLESDTATPCVWVRDIDTMELPIRHGEGKFVAPAETVERMKAGGQIALRYASRRGGS